jgi:hypothetical protein
MLALYAVSPSAWDVASGFLVAAGFLVASGFSRT